MPGSLTFWEGLSRFAFLLSLIPGVICLHPELTTCPCPCPPGAPTQGSKPFQGRPLLTSQLTPHVSPTPHPLPFTLALLPLPSGAVYLVNLCSCARTQRRYPSS